ncbi:MAG: hypothetical protein COW65_07595 [Cytophagales bacterium CG18_big_fil_WC_8_21_14_2_50_42_9]|nr:MAG: hypothetical protein COW65_07595 [Cytophagales bacterium CG18_big_fil_WC_8_21_14_2_50_42_9]
MNKCFSLTFLLLSFLFLATLPAQAQIITPDTIIHQDNNASLLPRKKPVWFDSLSYRFIGDGNFTRGNINRSLVVLRTELTVSGPVITLTTNPRFTYGKQNNVLAERDTYADLFLDVLKENRIYGFGMATLETSNLRGIDLRKLVGVGIGLRLYQTPQNTLSLTNAIIHEATNFRERPTLTTQRNSTRLKGSHSFLQDKVRFTHITFVQPALNDFSNVRWNTILSLELPLSKWVTIRSSYENNYESIVEAGRKRHDSRVTFGLAFGNRP